MRAESRSPRPGGSAHESARVDAAVHGLFTRDATFSLLRAVQMLAVALATPVITRLLGPVEFGHYATALAAMQVLVIVAGLGLEAAIQRAFAGPGGEEEARRILTLAVLAGAGIAGVAGATTAQWGTLLGFRDGAVELRLAVASAGLLAVVSAGQALLRSQDRLRPFGATCVLMAVAAPTVGVFVASAFGRTAAAFFAGLVLAQLPVAVLAITLAGLARLRFADRGAARRALVFGVPLISVGLNAVVLTAGDRFVVAEVLGTVAVARYHIAYSVGALPLLLMWLVSWAWLPRLLALQGDADRALVLGATRDALYRLILPVIVGIGFGAPLVLRVWSPASFAVDELLLTTVLVVISVVPFTAAIIRENVLLVRGRSMAIALTTTSAAAANVLMNLLLVPVLGLVGAALTTVLAYGLLYITQRASSRTSFGIVPSSARSRLALLGAVGVALLTAVALPTSPLFLALRAVAAAACVAWFLRMAAGVARGPQIAHPAPEEARRP